MKLFNFWIHEDLKQRVFECSHKQQMKQSEFVREALIRFCDEVERNERINSNRRS